MLRKKKILIASDHAGFELKKYLKKYLESKNYKVFDCGTNNGKDSVDYPDYANQLCGLIKLKKAKQGILICGTGIGMSITANKVNGIRAGLCHDAYTSEMARAHNNSNVLCFGARTTGEGTIESIIDAWDSTSFEGGRHLNRVKKINLSDR